MSNIINDIKDLIKMLDGLEDVSNDIVGLLDNRIHESDIAEELLRQELAIESSSQASIRGFALDMSQKLTRLVNKYSDQLSDECESGDGLKFSGRCRHGNMAHTCVACQDARK